MTPPVARVRSGRALSTVLSVAGASVPGMTVETEPEWLSRIRSGYDAVADTYAELFDRPDVERPEGPLEAAFLEAFVTHVARAGGGPVADVGCGPGRWTAWLAGRGVDCFGLDLSAEMVRRARALHPGVRFETGSMTRLDLPPNSLAGLLAWYSTMYLPDDAVPGVLDGFARAVRPGGVLVLALQLGDGPRRIERPYGHDLTMEAHLRPLSVTAELVERAGFVVGARLERAPEGAERLPQGALLAHRCA